MQAVKGYYDNGVFTLDEENPNYSGRVVVLYLDEQETQAREKRFTTEEARAILKKYRGCLKGIEDPKAERLAYLDEKYNSNRSAD